MSKRQLSPWLLGLWGPNLLPQRVTDLELSKWETTLNASCTFTGFSWTRLYMWMRQPSGNKKQFLGNSYHCRLQVFPERAQIFLWAPPSSMPIERPCQMRMALFLGWWPAVTKIRIFAMQTAPILENDTHLGNVAWFAPRNTNTKRENFDETCYGTTTSTAWGDTHSHHKKRQLRPPITQWRLKLSIFLPMCLSDWDYSIT